MTIRHDIIQSVFNKAFKCDITLDDAVDLINNIIKNLEWDNDEAFCSDEGLDYVESLTGNCQAQIDWINKYKNL
jgi:hypothetical protein